MTGVSNFLSTPTVKSIVDGVDGLRKKFGYTDDLSKTRIIELYDNFPIVQRIVKVYPDYCWGSCPKIYDKDDTDEDTPFKMAVSMLDDDFNIFEQFKLADIYSRLIGYSVIYFNFNDGRKAYEPLDVSKANLENLIDIRTLHYNHVDIQSIDGDPTSPYFLTPDYFTYSYHGNIGGGLTISKGDFGYPFPQVKRFRRCTKCIKSGSMGSMRTCSDCSRKKKLYDMSKDDYSGTIHHSRCIFVCDKTSGSNYLGVSSLKPIYQLLLDYQLVKSSIVDTYNSSRGFLHVNVPKQTRQEHLMRVIQERFTDDKVGKSRAIITGGADQVDFLSNDVSDPTNMLNHILSLLSSTCGIPLKILMGVDDTSNSNNDIMWATQVNHRRNDFCNGRIIRPFIKYLFNTEIIKNYTRYMIKWDKNDYINPVDASTRAKDMSTSIAMYCNSPNAQNLVSHEQFTNEVLNLPYLTKDIQSQKNFKVEMGTKDITSRDESKNRTSMEA